MKPPILNRLLIRNFKSIRDSGSLRLGPLTVLIGNNGSGKSSVLEALETVQKCVAENIDVALQMWRGIEHVRNKARQHELERRPRGELRVTRPIVFQFAGRRDDMPFRAMTVWAERGGTKGLLSLPDKEVLFVRESVRIGTREQRREDNKVHTTAGEEPVSQMTLPAGKSLLNVDLGDYIKDWQFLTLWPQAMGNPTPQTRSRGRIRLAKDGANIAEFLMDIRSVRPAAFQGIIEAMQSVLPYADDMQPTLTTELERTVYLQLTEGGFKVPGWLLSTGTLRILALLALLRHPDPPPLIAIEEIENGLDPRTIHMLVDEIRVAVESRRTQVLATTHSPYLLDLLPLASLVLVDRVAGESRFTRPGDDEEVLEWAKSFAPGQLYTMNRLQREVPQ